MLRYKFMIAAVAASLTSLACASTTPVASATDYSPSIATLPDGGWRYAAPGPINGFRTQRDTVVVSADVGTGEVLTQISKDGSRATSTHVPGMSGAWAVPVFGGDVVIMTTGNQSVGVRNRAVVWSREGTTLPRLAMTINGTSVALFFNDGATTVTAINAVTGQTLWQRPVSSNGDVPYLTRQGARVFLTKGTDTLAVDPVTGDQLWRATVPGAQPDPAPLPDGGVEIRPRVLSATDTFVLAGMAQHVGALDPASGRLLWQLKPPTGIQVDSATRLTAKRMWLSIGDPRLTRGTLALADRSGVIRRVRLAAKVADAITFNGHIIDWNTMRVFNVRLERMGVMPFFDAYGTSPAGFFVVRGTKFQRVNLNTLQATLLGPVPKTRTIGVFDTGVAVVTGPGVDEELGTNVTFVPIKTTS